MSRKRRRRSTLGRQQCRIVTYKREYRGGPLLPRSKWHKAKFCEPGPPAPRPRPHHRPAPAPHPKEACSTTPRGTREILGTVGGAAVGLIVVAAGFFAVTSQDRALQQQAGAPSPKPGVTTGVAGVAAAVVGGVAGRFIATRKPTC